MIVQEYDKYFIMIDQHEHALISGEFAKRWGSQYFIGEDRRSQVELAIAEHDRAWIPLDQSPSWNDEKDAPHSFMDYPTEPKVIYYEKGIDIVQKESLYAGLLSSKHYLSFFDHHSTDPIISRFISREIDRQNRLIPEIGEIDQKEMHFHFQLLQFCDDLSLYLCLNEPGVDKADENKMFKDGFRQTFDKIDSKIIANWKSEEVVLVDPFPFDEPFEVSLPYRKVFKSDINSFGLQEAFEQSKVEHLNIRIEQAKPE
ncbi:DUF3891 domain-containing protein [Halalkalibacillus sediminis]|uniref:DUF3891 domain-containing protein n=1 Tax=Halalkalibacillus sediminis TaxID=2018042 RepID=A0A2I0QT33_9BACI|nr:DUF3891 family protein [Halalkalibacillus sediminis]PKR77469.1 DUF3891 domain-containing protein [Halalkalibacillus sediminis]